MKSLRSEDGLVDFDILMIKNVIYIRCDHTSKETCSQCLRKKTGHRQHTKE